MLSHHVLLGWWQKVFLEINAALHLAEETPQDLGRKYINKTHNNK